MKSFISRFFQRIFTVGQSRRTKALFQPIDKDKVKKELQIEERARRDGERNQPSSDSRSLSATEHAIKSKVQEHYKKLSAEYSQEIHLLRRDHEVHVANLNTDHIKNQEKLYLDEAHQEKKLVEGILGRVSQDLISRAKELLIFRQTHRLMHRSPVIHNFFWTGTILLLAFAAEVVVTFVLTREAGPPVTLAILVVLYCALNFWIPFFFARFVKAMFYHPIDRAHLVMKISGSLLAVLLVLLLLGLNLGMGHYRSTGVIHTDAPVTASGDIAGVLQALSQQGENLRRAWNNFRTNPFGIEEIQSWFLVVFGWFLSFLALYEGVTRKERYPEYGRLDEEYGKTFNQYRKEMEDFNNRMNKIREKAVDYVDRHKSKLNMAIQAMPELADKSDSIYQGFEQARKNLVEDYMYLLSLYRDENIHARSDKPPSRIPEEESLDLFRVEKYNLERADMNIDKEVVLNDLDRQAKSIHDQIDAIAESIPSAADIINRDDDPRRIE